MKRQRSNSEAKKKKHSVLTRKLDSQIQADWQRATEKSLCNFINNSPLKKIASFIDRDYYVNLHPALVSYVLERASPVYGVYLSLTATIETMRDVCHEAASLILAQSGNPDTLQKTPVSITLLYETLSMIDLTYDELIATDHLLETTPLQTRHILENDRHRDWLRHYKEAKQEKIHVFTVRMGPGTQKATANTGDYIVSVLLPLQAPTYRLVPAHEPHSQAYEDLEMKLMQAMVQLNSYQRMAKLVSKGKHTPKDEADILARQLQHKELESLRHLTADQNTQLAILSRQNAELNAVINSPTFQDTRSLQDSLILMKKKLKESRRRNFSLFRLLRIAEGKELASEEGIRQRKQESEAKLSLKRQKTLNGYITSSSYNSDDEDDEDDSPYGTLNNTDDDEEEDEEDEDDSL